MIFMIIVVVVSMIKVTRGAQNDFYNTDSVVKLIDEIRLLIPDDVTTADSLMRTVMELAIGSQVDSVNAKACMTAGDINFYQARYFVAINYYNQCLSNPYTTNNTEFANDVYKLLGQAYYFTDQKEKAIEAFEKKPTLCRNIGRFG